ncbi:TPA: hypothetical protein DCX16_05200 [bacterium]|nr:hypothetical protein [bacterium]
MKIEEKIVKKTKKDKESIGERIKIFRKNLLISQKELAKNVGITQAHLCRIENNKAFPSMKLFNKIADALGIHPKYLFIPYSKNEEYNGKLYSKGESLYEKLPDDIKYFLSTQENGMIFIQAVKNFMVSDMTLDDITRLVNVFKIAKETEELAR